MIKEALKELGLTNNESEVYLKLLSVGSATANEIARISGLHRQAVYDALDRLLEKGFASYVVKNNKKCFQGISPEKILDYLKDKEEDFRSVLPQLARLTRLPKESTSVEVFKGKGVIRTVYRDIIKEFATRRGEVLLSGAEEKKFMEEDLIALKQHIGRLKKMGCRERILIRKGDRHLVEGSQTAYRCIGKESFNPTPMYVYNDTLTIIIWGNPNHAIITRNRNLADAYRKQFNLLWKIAGKVRQ
ncbi:MAG: helix-turn-helix domain-containing protein [archaeon]